MKFIYISLLFVLLFNCENTTVKRTELLDFVPENTSVLIKSPNIDGVKSGIKNNDFFKKISTTKTYKNLENKLDNLSALKPSSDLLLCFSQDENDILQYSIITKYHNTLFKTDSLTNYIEESLVYEDKTITKSTINDNVLYSAVIDSIFFASSSKTIVQSIFNTTYKNTELKKIYHTTENNKTLSVIINPNNAFVKSFFIQETIALNTFTDYLAVDVELHQNSIQFNGIAKANDSTKSLINVFKNTIPQENQTQRVTPPNSDGFISLTFNNFDTIEANLRKFQNKSPISHAPDLFNDIIEVGVIYENNNRAIVLNSIDVIATNDALLAERTLNNSYREVELYDFSKPEIFTEIFTPFITFNEANVYCVLDNFFVFSNNIEMLQNIISNYQNKTTLANKEFYKNTKEQLSNASSLLQVNNESLLKPILNRSFNVSEDLNLSHYNASAIQFIYDNNFAHVNGVIQKQKIKASKNSISEEINIKLEFDLLNHPQFVTNHISKQKEIVVQDVKNNLYLISNSGNIIWKKQLQGPVLGRIEQIDMYKNGKLQLAFTTPNRLYILDRNGNEVNPFALKFEDEITQPLSVFDYDNRKDYRFLITQGKNLLMYNIEGKNVKGFKFKAANNTIICQPKHFRIVDKDYIAFKTKDKIYILNRTGQTRVKTETFLSYSNEPIFLYNDTFTTTSENGNLISINTKGNVVTQNLNLSSTHTLQTTNKTLVTQTENKLFIKNKTTELDFGHYTKPKIFYINDKIYVSITDLQAHKIYLFDSQSNLLPNFPVYGNSPIELEQIDKDTPLEFVTKGENNSIILYQIN